jgi:hypothetical protein
MKTLVGRATYLLGLVDSLTTLADIAGVKPPSVSDWLNGKTMSIAIEPATRLGKHFNLDPMWISKGKGKGPVQDVVLGSIPAASVEKKVTLGGDFQETDILLIDRLDVKVKGGRGLAPPDNEQVVSQVQVLKSWLSRMVFNLRGPLKIIEAYERSMEPTICQGDLLLVDTGATEPDISGIYILIRVNRGGDEEIMVKRLRREPLGEGIEIVSDNKIVGGEPVLVKGKNLNDLYIKGRVVYVWHGEKV